MPYHLEVFVLTPAARGFRGRIADHGPYSGPKAAAAGLLLNHRGFAAAEDPRQVAYFARKIARKRIFTLLDSEGRLLYIEPVRV